MKLPLFRGGGGTVTPEPEVENGIGTWVWNDTLQDFQGGSVYDSIEFNFSCKERNYIAIGSADGILSYITNLEGSSFIPPWIDDSTGYIISGGSWEGKEEYRTIVVSEPITNNAALEYLKNNATKQSGGTATSGHTATLNISEPSATGWNQMNYSVDGGEWKLIGWNTATPITLTNVSIIKFANAPKTKAADLVDLSISGSGGGFTISPITLTTGEQSEEISISVDTTFELSLKSWGPIEPPVIDQEDVEIVEGE